MNITIEQVSNGFVVTTVVAEVTTVAVYVDAPTMLAALTTVLTPAQTA